MKKGPERYFFFFFDDDASIDRTGEVLHRFASDPNLSLSWYDATILGDRLREMKAKLPELGQDDDERRPRGEQDDV
jgi:hypothetical protein